MAYAGAGVGKLGRPVDTQRVGTGASNVFKPLAAVFGEQDHRHAAAIMFTDIAGYTRLSGRDEKAAMKLIKQQRKMLKPIVKEHDGEWVKEMGDGLLLCFPSSLSAVTCAIAIQEATRAEPHLDLRIGLHQGDIMQDGSDVYGDGVNIASRIEPYAPVGGIAVSEKIQQDVSSHPEINIELLGEFELDGVGQRVEIYTVTSNFGEALEETRWIEPDEPMEEEQEAPEEPKKKGRATKEEILGEQEPAATETVQAGDLLGQEQWVSLRDQSDAGAQHDLAGGAGGPGQGDVGVGEMGVGPRDLTTGGREGAVTVDGYRRVFSVPDGLETQVLGLLGHECRVYGVGRQGYRRSNAHLLLSSFDSSGYF